MADIFKTKLDTHSGYCSVNCSCNANKFIGKSKAKLNRIVRRKLKNELALDIS